MTDTLPSCGCDIERGRLCSYHEGCADGVETGEYHGRLSELGRLSDRIDGFRSRLQPESHPLAQGSYDALGLVMRDITARIRELEGGET